MTGPITVGVKREEGFTLIDMLFVIAIIGLLSTIAIPGLMRARGAAQSSSALGTIRLANSGQLSYAIMCGLGFYAPDFPTLTTKPPGAAEAFLPAELATGITFFKSGYNFSMAGTPNPGAPATCNGLAPGLATPAYALVGDMVGALPNKGRHFGTNADGIIYEDVNSLGAIMPESGPPASGTPIH